jgi:hypothetical protein
MGTAEYKEWLASLKPGDKVAAECGYNPEYGYDYAIEVIEKVAPTGHIWLVGGKQYQPDGVQREKLIPDFAGWGDPCYKLVEITPKVEETRKRRELLCWLKNIEWYQLSTEMLEAIAQVLRRHVEDMQEGVEAPCSQIPCH